MRLRQIRPPAVLEIDEAIAGLPRSCLAFRNAHPQDNQMSLARLLIDGVNGRHIVIR